MSTISGESFKLSLPSEWLVDSDDVLAFYKSDGVGCIQVSEYSNTRPVVPSDLTELAQEHIDAGAKVKEIGLGSFQGITLAFGDERSFWQHWYVSNSNTLLFITYNCDLADIGIELPEVKNLLDQLSAA